MMYLIHSDETASSNIADSLKRIMGLEEKEPFNGLECFGSKEVTMLGIKGSLIEAEFLDGILHGPMLFLSRHRSGKGIPAFTVHPEGNWSDEAALGGRPKELSVASPFNMLKILKSISTLNKTDIELTYEATHHGPFTNNPSLFVELGGNESIIASKPHAEFMANAVASSMELKPSYDKVAVGIGSLHYPSKFTRLALEGKYIFSHIMPKYYVDNIDMLQKAFERSDLKAELAVIEWKGIKGNEREIILRELQVLGIDYAKV